MDLLKDQTVFITGAGQGIGKAVALGIAGMGAQVFASDVNEDAVGETTALIREAGGIAHALKLDVSDANACREAAELVTREISAERKLLLVNNAGVRPRHAFDSEDRDEEWQRTLDINLSGTRNTIHAFQALLASTGGSVVNMGSIAASRAAAGSVAYSTSKAAVEMLTKVMALELAPQGIRVNAVAPGVMLTAMTESTRKDPKHVEYIMRRVPLKRYGDPAELAGPIAFLGSSLASYITGTVLGVDGGYLIS
ncbi:SDR family oxidoreductase [Diaphorobacter sp. HDW4A]|uniref:SDR family NAD(P)-dependent oxidoreductase n=1 Tax=Diaphorobacter sp. HDW4A TaxID=2714924 RepID=UPI00140A8AA0|nr:SDR family NAD(P)-dependent oxidoreductase [Diaphorobacter sp. HDW4A]QIL82780.1 SDR family oxidoreductase [Diaphorobacter sp. HDW4A]